MVCPVCPASSLMGGVIGSYFFGINPPESKCLKVVSVILTGTATTLTTLAIIVFGKVSLCQKNYTLPRISMIIAGAVVVGTIYSIAINFLLNKYVERTKQNTAETKENKDSTKNCCK
ncbi:MAG: hypothetical protein H0W88_10895 [Parachlamydiaceae bacterium]|nr:hypothetical protein [Parachlamydiaceae bacterium]